jgi:phage N-6-adenine-methyltransferase
LDGGQLTQQEQRVEARDLPSIIDAVERRLSEARSSAEVLEAKRQAEAALHYSKVCKAANETQADCIRMIVRAEMRMADEIDRGQEQGEVATRGKHEGNQYSGNVRASDNSTITISDLGLSRQRVAEWRRVRDAGQEVVNDAIDGALAQGRAPTKSDVKRAAEEATRSDLTPTPSPSTAPEQPKAPQTFSVPSQDVQPGPDANTAVEKPAYTKAVFTGENEWYTPQQYLDAAREVMGDIDLDAASSEAAQRLVGATQYFTKEDDALTQTWAGRVWLNPPYSQPDIAHFIRKLVSEVSEGNVEEAVLLTHNYTDTGWFHDIMQEASAVCFTRGRVKFYNAKGETAAPTQGQAFSYFGPNVERFAEIFKQYGFVVGGAL